MRQRGKLGGNGGTFGTFEELKEILHPPPTLNEIKRNPDPDDPNIWYDSIVDKLQRGFTAFYFLFLTLFVESFLQSVSRIRG